MTTGRFRHGRIFCALGVSLWLAGCGGGGGGGGGSDTSFNCDGTAGSVAISGTAEYEFVPAVKSAVNGARLDYSAAAYRPIRNAQVQAICPDGSSTYATTTTDAAGGYALAVPENVDVAIRVRALMIQDGLPSWDVRVVDNTKNQAVWSAQGETFNSGTGSVTVDLGAASGWGGSGYTATRAAAPFAILDSVHAAMQKVLTADASATFPPLKLNWSASNRATCSGNDFPFADGCIGTSFFANFGGGELNIFILGSANNDTDEYDNHVIIHEWGHYYENTFARSDSIGGAHSGGDALDPRVAFGEGWGNAFSGIATDDPVYVDTMGNGQSGGFWNDVESNSTAAAGWWNENSIQSIIYDLYDIVNDDAAALGFAPIHAVLANQQRLTEAMTSIFPLVHYLRTDNPGDQANIDAVVAMHDISPITDEWGSGRTGLDDGSQFGREDFITPVYTDLGVVGTGSTANICTTNALDSASEYNRLGARRFLRFSPDADGDWLLSLEGDGADPDFFVYASGVEITDSRSQDASENGANDSSTAVDGAVGIETAVIPLFDDIQYIVEVTDWANVDDSNGPGDDICLDITFTPN